MAKENDSKQQDETAPPPVPKQRPAKQVKVRVVKQPVHHEGRAYFGPRQGAKGPLPAETFMVDEDRAEALGDHVEIVAE